jgi:YegS C-terminal NAD kinase beta sandwich-like domain
MTIRRGDDWGEIVTPPAGLVDVADDAAAADRIAAGDGRPLRLRGGDLLATLGGPASDGQLRRLPIDILRGTADGLAFTAVAHVVARRSWWRGPVVAVMNVDHLARWDVAPRAHPNDGRADVVEVDARMGRRARWQAWRRLASGTHVPHPQIAVRRTTGAGWIFERPLRLWVDGVARGTVRSLRVDVEPDAAVVHC